MKYHKGWTIANSLLVALVIIISSLNIFYMFNYHFLDVMALNYVVVVIICLLIAMLIGLIVTKKLKLFTMIFSIIFLVGSGFVFANLYKAVDLFDTLHANTTKTEQTLSVVVLKDSDYDKLSDLKGVDIEAPLKSEQENMTALKQAALAEQHIDLTLVEGGSYAQVYNHLIDGKSKAVVISSAHENLIELHDPNYAAKIKKLFEFKVKKVAIPKPVKQENTKAFTVYISGIDTYGPITSVSRSDINILMTVNTQTNKILLTNTPRDAYVPIADGGNNQYDKLTHAGIYGIDASIHTLENLYNTKIDYYARINFTSFLALIDLLGGVDVYNDQAFTSLHGNYQFPVGEVHLDSQKALGFVRERYSLTDGDNDRGKNQQKVITAVIQKLTTKEALVNIDSILNELSKAIQTNMPIAVALSLANEQLNKNSPYHISSQALTGFGEVGLPSYAMPGYQLYMMKVDENSLSHIKTTMKAVLEGE